LFREPGKDAHVGVTGARVARPLPDQIAYRYWILTGRFSQRRVYRLLLNDARQDEKSADRGTDHQNESNLTHE
jgi:hypothetical protein